MAYGYDYVSLSKVFWIKMGQLKDQLEWSIMPVIFFLQRTRVRTEYTVYG